MKKIFICLFLLASSSSFAETIQVERSWKEVGCKAVSAKYGVKRFDLEYCVDNSAFSIRYENYRDQKVPFNFKGYLFANPVNENCNGILLLDQSGHFVEVLKVVCDL